MAAAGCRAHRRSSEPAGVCRVGPSRSATAPEAEVELILRASRMISRWRGTRGHMVRSVGIAMDN
jgi:hypothetical protein